MVINIEHRPGYALATCSLDNNESIKAESGAMVGMSSNVAIESKSGGILKGAKRMLFGGESFFQNNFTAKGGPGEVFLSPTLPGDICKISMKDELIIQGTSYLASEPSIEIDSKFSGLKGLFSGEGLFMLKATGNGEILVSSFGAIHELDIDGEYIVDGGHIVAFETGLDYKIKTVGGWVSTFFSGEGLVCKFTGKGKLYIQTRNPDSFGTKLGNLLYPRNQ